MFGGVAVRANLLCVTWTAAQGHVFLFDLEARQRVSAWPMPRGPAGYSDAAGVAIDEHFQVYVADPHNQRVCRFSVFGRHLGDLGAAPPSTGDQGRDRPGVLDLPTAVALCGNEVWVAGGDKPRRRSVQRFAADGSFAGVVAARGDVEASFHAPRGLWADPGGVVVADTQAGQLLRYRRNGTFVAAVRCGPAGRARPVGVVRRGDGALVFVDRGDLPGVRAVGPDGAPVALGEVATTVHDPVAVALDQRGTLYVLDRGGERVQRFLADGAWDGVVVDLEEHLDDYAPGEP